jgi:hypothetical protein
LNFLFAYCFFCLTFFSSIVCRRLGQKGHRLELVSLFVEFLG